MCVFMGACVCVFASVGVCVYALECVCISTIIVYVFVWYTYVLVHVAMLLFDGFFTVGGVLSHHV